MEWNESSEHIPLASITVFGVVVKLGDRVRLWPQKAADILDFALKGKVAIVEAIERDFDDHTHVAVVLEDDPGRDLGMLRQPGHRFFFSPDELEPIGLNHEVTREQ
jgi:ABC-type Fe3+ transport system substrate-binding protein